MEHILVHQHCPAPLGPHHHAHISLLAPTQHIMRLHSPPLAAGKQTLLGTASLSSMLHMRISAQGARSSLILSRWLMNMLLRITLDILFLAVNFNQWYPNVQRHCPEESAQLLG